MTYAQKAANVIITEAVEFMAAKAGVSVDEIVELISSNSNAAKYFADLVKIGIVAAAE